MPGSNVIQDTETCLYQAIEVISSLSDAQFTETYTVHSSSIGAHMRHIIDHYTCLLSGVETGRINYDSRDRNPEIENSTATAITALRDVLSRLTALPQSNLTQSVTIIQNCGTQNDHTASTVERELQFLSSHSIHHYAIIGILLQLSNLPVPDQFGWAPSTINYLKQCAP